MKTVDILNKVSSVSFFAISLFTLIGCAPAYIPNALNTPMLSNKGEVQATLCTGTSGVDPQFAVAVSDNIGLMVNGSFANRGSDSASFHKHNFVELGGGYFTQLSSAGRFEVYGGYGLGNVNTEYYNNLWTSYANVNSQRAFIQPAIGAATDYFDGSFATRLVYVHLEQENVQRNSFFVEPTLTAKAGYKYVKLFGQLGLSLPLSAPLQFDYQPLIFSIGLQVTIGRNWDKE